MNQYFATCPKGLEGLLFNELKALGVDGLRETVAGVYFKGSQKSTYKVCLWTRLANRILLPLQQQKITSGDDLYQAAKSIQWPSLFNCDRTFLVDFIGTNDEIRNSQFGAQSVKDAIVDHFNETTGERPSVDKADPDVRINVRLAKNTAYFSLDYSGESLHRRGYRQSQGAAPLKENLAAALVLRTGWPATFADSRCVVDPMCGSATILIEACLIALNIAPGIYRKQFGFEHLRDFDATTWSELKDEAEEIKKQSLAERQFSLFGYDVNPNVLNAAKANIQRAGLEEIIHVALQDAKDLVMPALPAIGEEKEDKPTTGLIICNPPYGERLGEMEALKELYLTLAKAVKIEFSGWQLAVFTGNEQLSKEMRLRPKKIYKLFNGTIASQLVLFDLMGQEKTLRKDIDDIDESMPLTEGAQMVFNRLAKNKKRMDKWIKNNNIECYRIYDADIPEYSAAIDVYGDYIHIQEYQAPKSVDERKAKIRLSELTRAAKQFFSVDSSKIVTKVRKRNRGKDQYEKHDHIEEKISFIAQEGGAKLRINLSGYLDSGLFLDHRPLRKMIADSVLGKSFLNLFCYTASATVHAALGGAKSSVSVDMSNTYLEWASENFDLNNINRASHQLVREDCFKWLKECRQGFDVIMLDPPSFSNSKKMEDVLDVQRDHVMLIKRCMEILSADGVLYFSTNLRSFKLDYDRLFRWDVEDISQKTLDLDFKQNPKIHYCWKITFRDTPLI